MEPTQPRTSRFRVFIGLIALAAGVGGLFGLYAFPIPADNREPLYVALGIILGWGTQVVQSEFGGSATGRKLAERAAEHFKP